MLVTFPHMLQPAVRREQGMYKAAESPLKLRHNTVLKTLVGQLWVIIISPSSLDCQVAFIHLLYHSPLSSRTASMPIFANRLAHHQRWHQQYISKSVQTLNDLYNRCDYWKN
jgi:hypothetical protein